MGNDIAKIAEDINKYNQESLKDIIDTLQNNSYNPTNSTYSEDYTTNNNSNDETEICFK